MLRKIPLALLVFGFLSVAPVFADGTDIVDISLLSLGFGDIGTSGTLTAGPWSVVVSGYSAPLALTDLFVKNGGPTEMGVGLANGLDHEISGTEFIQLDLTKI